MAVMAREVAVMAAEMEASLEVSLEAVWREGLVVAGKGTSEASPHHQETRSCTPLRRRC